VLNSQITGYFSHDTSWLRPNDRRSISVMEANIIIFSILTLSFHLGSLVSCGQVVLTKGERLELTKQVFTGHKSRLSSS